MLAYMEWVVHIFPPAPVSKEFRGEAKPMSRFYDLMRLHVYRGSICTPVFSVLWEHKVIANLKWDLYIDSILQLLSRAQHRIRHLVRKQRSCWTNWNSRGLKDHCNPVRVLSCWPLCIGLFTLASVFSLWPQSPNHRKVEKYNKWAFSTHPSQSPDRLWSHVKGATLSDASSGRGPVSSLQCE